MQELLQLCGIHLTGDLADGQWHMAKIQTTLIPSFVFLVKLVDATTLKCARGEDYTTVSVWDCNGNKQAEVLEVIHAIDYLLGCHLREQVWETVHKNSLK